MRASGQIFCGLLTGACLVGCVLPTGRPAAEPIEQASRHVGKPQASSTAGPLDRSSDTTPAPTQEPEASIPLTTPTATPVPTETSAPIAAIAPALSGLVTIPAGLIANNGSSLISDHGGSYRLAALSEPAVQAEVGLVDENDQLLAGTDWVKTDDEGRYAFAEVPASTAFYVRARVTGAETTYRFTALGRLTADTGTVVNVSPASSLVAAKTRVVAEEQDQAIDSFDPAQIKALTDTVAAELTPEALPDFSGGAEDVSAALDKLLQADASLMSRAWALDKNVGTPHVRVKRTLDGGMFRPQHCAYDSRGNLFIAGLDDHTVWELEAGSTTLRPFFKGGDLKWPYGVAIDGDDNVYVSRCIDLHYDDPENTTGNDTPGKQVFKISPDGLTITTLPYTFSGARGLCMSHDGKTLYVANYEGGRIVAYDLATNTGRVLASDIPNPIGIAEDSRGTLYVTHYRAEWGHTDANANGYRGAVATVDAATGSTTLFYSGLKTITGADRLEGIVVDAADNLYVSNNWGNTIFKFTPKKKKIETFLEFSHPTGLALDPQGNLAVSDFEQGTISLITP